MPRRRKPYPPEFRKQMVELVRAGRTPYELAKEFETTAQTIANWVIQAEPDEGLTTAQKGEHKRLRRENKQLRLGREVLAKAAPWSIPPTSSGS